MRFHCFFEQIEDKYCEYCGKKLERKRYSGRIEDFNVFAKRKYCDRECMKQALSERRKHYDNGTDQRD